MGPPGKGDNDQQVSHFSLLVGMLLVIAKWAHWKISEDLLGLMTQMCMCH